MPLTSDSKAKPEEMACMKISVREGRLLRALQEKALLRPNYPKGSSTEVRPIGQFGKASECTVEGPFLCIKSLSDLCS